MSALHQVPLSASRPLAGRAGRAVYGAAIAVGKAVGRTRPALWLLALPVSAGPLGLGQLEVEIMTSVSHDSNLYGTERAQGDTFATVAPRVTYLRQAGRIEAEAHLGMTIRRYANLTQLDREDLDLGFTLRLPAADGRHLAGWVMAVYRQDEAVDLDLNTRLAATTVSLSGESTLQLGPRTRLGVQGNYTDITRKGASDQQTLNTSAHYVYENFYHGTALHLNGGYGQLQTSGENEAGVALDQRSVEGSVGLSRPFIHAQMRLGASLGYRVLKRSADETPAGSGRQGGTVLQVTLDGPFLPERYFPKVESSLRLAYQAAATPGINDTGNETLTGAMRLGWQARDATRLSIGLTRVQRLSTNDLSVVESAIRLQVDQRLSHRMNLEVGFARVWSSYAGGARDDRSWTGNAGLHLALSRKWSGSLTALVSERTSAPGPATISRQLLSLSVRYRF